MGVRFPLPASSQQLNNISDMKKYYITSDKVGEFVARMYAAGIRVDSDPEARQLTVNKPGGGYEWIYVFDKGSFDELCCAFLPKESHILNTEG